MRVTDTGQGGTLARTHAGKPGLPRGRSRLPLSAVRASQRERLLRSVIAAVSESGDLAVTVADIVRPARVSRAAFYAHFADKEDCFLAATAEGRELLIAQVVSATRALARRGLRRGGAPGRVPGLPRVPDRRARVRQGLRYPHADGGPPRGGPADAGTGMFTELNKKWHQRAREHHPEWPAVPSAAYLALAGATVELVRSMVRAGWTDALPELEETLVSLHLAVLAGRPWPPG